MTESVPQASEDRVRLFEHLRLERAIELFTETDAHLFIGQIAVRKDGRLQMNETAQNINTVLKFDTTMPDRGLYWSRGGGKRSKIIVNPNRGLSEAEITFGHEVGHYFMDEVLDIGEQHLDWTTEEGAEIFCETFGRMMAGPPDYPLTEAECYAKFYLSSLPSGSPFPSLALEMA